MTEVETKIKIYEVNGEETKINKDPHLSVRSHWNYHDFVVISFDDDNEITVVADDLIKAIENAKNR